MKKSLLLLLLIGILLLSASSVNALTLNEDGTYTNKRGVKITAEQYKYLSSYLSDGTIDGLIEKAVLTFSDPNVKKSVSTEYSITTDTIRYGVVVDSTTITTTEEEAMKVAKNKNLHVLSDNTLHDISEMPMPLYDSYDVDYSTSSKKISLLYAELNDNRVPTAVLDVEWFTIPKIKKYDILAFRWDKSMPTSNVSDYVGVQDAFDKNGEYLYSHYDLNSNNVKITNYGFGQIMNIGDRVASDLRLWIYVEFEKNVGNTIYASYQHARNSNITLSGAQSYTFKASGLG